jgi:hypothetical protein
MDIWAKKKFRRRIICGACFHVMAGNCRRERFRPFQAAGGAFIVCVMTRMRYIATDRNAQNSACFAVRPRGLLLLTLR